MTDAINLLWQSVVKTADALKKRAGKPIINATDIDADGMCSAHLVDQIGMCLNSQVEHVYLERPFVPVLKRIYEVAREKDASVLFTDHGGGSEEDIIREAGSTLTAVIDHHGSIPVHEVTPLPDTFGKTFFCCNGNHWGVHGDRNATSSTITYMLLKHIAPELAPWHAHIALLGAAGDKTPWKRSPWPQPNSADIVAYQDALSIDEPRFEHNPSDTETDNQCIIHFADDHWYGCRNLASMLTSLGMVRRLELHDRVVENGPEIVLGILKQGSQPYNENAAVPRIISVAEACHERINELFKETWQRAVTNNKLICTEIAIYVDTGNEFAHLWPKAVGVFGEYLRKQAQINPWMPQKAYLIAGMPLKASTVLGKKVAPYPEDGVRAKVSIRCTEKLDALITQNQAPEVSAICQTYMEQENSHATRGAGIPKEDAKKLPQQIMAYCTAHEKEFWRGR